MSSQQQISFEGSDSRLIELPTLIGEEATSLCDRQRGWYLLAWGVAMLGFWPLMLVADGVNSDIRWWFWAANGLLVPLDAFAWVRMFEADRRAAKSVQEYLTQKYGVQFRRPAATGQMYLIGWRRYLRREFTRLNVPRERWPASVTDDSVAGAIAILSRDRGAQSLASIAPTNFADHDRSALVRLITLPICLVVVAGCAVLVLRPSPTAGVTYGFAIGTWTFMYIVLCAIAMSIAWLMRRTANRRLTEGRTAIRFEVSSMALATLPSVYGLLLWMATNGRIAAVMFCLASVVELLVVSQPLGRRPP